MKTWVNGTILEDAESFVSVFDHGLTVGDGVFETTKVVDGTAFALSRHLLRLQSSARGLGLPDPLLRLRSIACVVSVRTDPSATSAHHRDCAPPSGRRRYRYDSRNCLRGLPEGHKFRTGGAVPFATIFAWARPHRNCAAGYHFMERHSD